MSENGAQAMTILKLDTTQLRPGDIVREYGMRVLLGSDPRIETRDGRQVYAWRGDVLNAAEVIDAGRVPRTFLGDWVWTSNGWEFDQSNRWTVQGNDLARWSVERSDI